METTLEKFKSLISGLSADEMFDMMPRYIIIRGNKYYMDTYGPSNKLPSNIYHLMYYCYENQQVLVSLYDEDTRGINKKMLLRLLKNNYLSYKLITDEKNLGPTIQ